MIYKWIGAVFVIFGCGSFGFSLAAAHRNEIYLLQQLHIVLQYMRSELKYRMTPLPELCRLAGRETAGTLRAIFTALSQALESQVAPDVAGCMSEVVKQHRDRLPGSLRKLLLRLGKSLGRFDLSGQLRGLEAIGNACQEELSVLKQNRDLRTRNYQTLALCAGIALVILFI